MKPIDILEYRSGSEGDALWYLFYANDILGIKAIYEIFEEYPEVGADLKFYSYSEMPPEAKEALAKKRSMVDDTIKGTFVNRYNDRLLKLSFDYDSYLADKEIQKLIHELDFDIVKYWYLLLFVYDYSQSICMNGKKTIDSPYSQLEKLTNIIAKNVESFNWADGIKINKEIKLTIEVEGERKKLVIDDPNAVGYLYHSIIKTACEEKIQDRYIMTQRRIVNISTSLPNSAHIYYFANILLRFMGSLRYVWGEEKAVKHTKKELELTSRLIYFTGLSKNKNFCDIESDTLKGYLSRKKEINEVSNIYPIVEW